MKSFGLLGERLSHSYSPMIHAELGDYAYLLYEKKPEELDSFFSRAGFDGLNVTIPYKTAVIKYCTELSEAAAQIGSVNTIVKRADGTLYGDNTDYYGFAYLLRRAGANPAGAKAVILGGGGSSLTARAVLGDAGAREIITVSRAGPDNYGNIGRHADAALIVNTTPVGMYPDNGASPVADLGLFTNCRHVVDMIYNPLTTELMFQARKYGITCANGLAMLVAQAKRAAELFTHRSVPDDTIETIIKKIERTVRNIVLIGMPGCGKTTVGAELARLSGRGFIDTDDEIAKAAGKPVSDIITIEGEAVFRKLETSALSDACKRSGLVIATGGGVVTRPENYRLIKQNGVVVFLNRDISELPATNRPLSLTIGTAALAKERLPLYNKWSDHTFTVRGAEQTAHDIYKHLVSE